MKMNKKGATGLGSVDTKMISVWIIAIILLVVLAEVLAELIPEFLASIEKISLTQIPFASFFTQDGIVALLLAVAIILFFIFVLLPSRKGKR